MSDLYAKDVSDQSPAMRVSYPIAQWALAEISGRDVAKFLQGQVTCNLDHLSDTCALWGAHCNVKGRAIANFILVQHATTILILCPDSTLPALTASLKKYGLFNQIDINIKHAALIATQKPLSPTKPTASSETIGTENAKREIGQFSTTPQEDGFTLALSPMLELSASWSALANPSDAPAPTSTAQPADSAQWLQGLIDAKLGFITAATAEAFIPIELNMDLLGGISFDKGCYLGQEIIARLHYRGQAKQRLCTLTLPENCPNLTAGAALLTNETKSAIGTIITAVQNKTGAGQALAVLRLGQIPESKVLAICAFRTAAQKATVPINPAALVTAALPSD